MILSMLKNVVAGLSFLHSAEPPIIHQELRSLKILLDGSCRAHLTDFQQDVVCSVTPSVTACIYLHGAKNSVLGNNPMPVIISVVHIELVGPASNFEGDLRACKHLPCAGQCAGPQKRNARKLKSCAPKPACDGDIIQVDHMDTHHQHAYLSCTRLRCMYMPQMVDK